MKKLKMIPHNEQGLLITVCGLDGCGKTTMLTKLIEHLKSEKVFVTKQPTSFVRNSNIFRTYMDSPDHSMYSYRSLSLMAASDRLQHIHQTILPQLAKGNIVLSDRYFYSCLANLRARGYVSDKWIYEISKSVIKPDISLFFDVSVDTAISRVRARPEERDRYIDYDLQQKLRDEYIEICKRNDGILISTEDSADESFKQVLQVVERKINNERYRNGR